VAVTVTVVEPLTLEASTGKLTLDWPAGTTKLEGTEKANALLLERATATPPRGAAAVKAMVTIADAPLLTADGLIAIDASAGGETVTVIEAS
jgi:hypothetical protein